MGRQELLVVALGFLLLIGVAWFIHGGFWRRGRLVLVLVALVAGLALLTRRVGLAELGILAVVLGLPLLVALPRRRPEQKRRR